ncbi:hypothetical protein D3C71_1830540 [compost metagenome]
MTFIDDDEIKEIRSILTEHVFAGSGQRLVDTEVHIAALADIPSSNLVAGIAKRREHLGHRVID